MSKKQKQVRKNKSLGNNSELTEKDAVILAAYYAYSKAADEIGKSAIDAFDTFARRLNGNPPEGRKELTVEQGKKELHDKVAFGNSLVAAERAFTEQQDALVKGKINEDLLTIKRQTATSVALIFCLVSPLVSDIEKPAIDWVKDGIITQYNKAREVLNFRPKLELAPSHPKALQGRGIANTQKAKKAIPQ